MGYIMSPNELANTWDMLLRDLVDRGVRYLLLFVVNGLKCIKDTIQNTYLIADVQRCMIHIMRNISSRVRVKDKKRFLQILNRFSSRIIKKTQKRC